MPAEEFEEYRTKTVAALTAEWQSRKALLRMRLTQSKEYMYVDSTE